MTNEERDSKLKGLESDFVKKIKKNDEKIAELEAKLKKYEDNDGSEDFDSRMNKIEETLNGM